MRSQNHDNMNGVKKPYIAVTCFQYLLDGFNRRDYDKNTEKGESRKERSSSMKRFSNVPCHGAAVDHGADRGCLRV